MYRFGAFVLTVLVAFGGYLYFNNKFPVDEEAYPNYVGYIDQETAALNEVIHFVTRKLFIMSITVQQRKDMLVVRNKSKKFMPLKKLCK